ncbi:hypothetical protein KJZ61_00015 [Candidatus Dependentiae bacterium]|nr:hypothetical protein [Candidatus Dependentiae bacterium]
MRITFAPGAWIHTGRITVACISLCGMVSTKYITPFVQSDEGVRQAAQQLDAAVNSLISDLHVIKQTTKSPISEAGTITAAGSYILTNTIEGSITIAASNVFLDLNGYGVHNESEEGCIIVQGVSRVTITNGHVAGLFPIIVVAPASQVLVQACLVRCTTSAESVGITFSDSPLATCVINSCMITSTAANIGRGVQIDSDTDSNNCIIIDQCYLGLLHEGVVFTGNQVNIQHCFFSSIDGVAVVDNEVTTPSISVDNTIRNNVFNGCDQGILSANSTTLIRNNCVRSCTLGIAATIIDHDTVYGNIALDNTMSYSAIPFEVVGAADTTGCYANIVL